MPLSLLKSLLPWGARSKDQQASPPDPASTHTPSGYSAAGSPAYSASAASPEAPTISLTPPARRIPAPGRQSPGGSASRGPRHRGAPEPQILAAQTLGIRQAAIHPHVHHICATLQKQGQQALIVGGAVRDLILGRQPKDFDIVTSAKPEQVKRVFRNARIIGRRFRLCLLRFGDMKVEVSTFRGLPRSGADGMIHRDNTYGTPREDAFRRDFTCNALTLDPLSMTIIDYVGGLEDLQARRIRTIAAPPVSFAEDPVRMLRALRFSVRLGFALDPALERAIVESAPTLRQVKRHRLADETQRFLTSGLARATFDQFAQRGLLEPLLALEEYGWFFSPEALDNPLAALSGLLAKLDRWVGAVHEPLPPTVVLLALVVTLAKPEFRAYLGAAGANPHAKLLGRYKRDLPKMLAEWGLLRGQVEPALRILGAARLLLSQQSESAARTRPPQMGEREAWLLLGIVGDLLGADPDTVRQGVERVHELPDLPILDHPRPTRRGSAPIREGFRQSDTVARNDATPSPDRKRRRRRRGSRR